MVRKKKSPQKKCACPKPVLAVRTKQRQLPHRKRSQNLFGAFPKKPNPLRPFYVSYFANGSGSSKFRSGIWTANFTTPSAQGIPPGNTTQAPLFAP